MPKQRDPNHVFVAMAKKDENLPSPTRDLWENLATGRQLGRWKFTRAHCLSFSTPKARNILTHCALQTDASLLLMVDADMNAGEAQIERILSHNVDAVGGLYPRKNVSFKQEWVANFVRGSAVRPDGLWEVVDIGAGWLLLRLSAIERLIELHPETAYLCDDPQWIGQTMHALWAEGPVTDDWNLNGKPYSRYLTEDFYLCYRLRKAGFQVWADTVCQIGHIGMADYLAIMTHIQMLQGGLEGAERPVNPLLPPNVR